ncbi:flavin reductase family protein [Actinoplanes sp. NPDC051411]|jgi:flavin reductase (DIM6/NTAB) family NADH-FMN oxidoreductase RutF|uniref:flavin reductase family protein n=1 Tax=Actinoplanes sp. NPDC051411 TaxID=3155522 RepID=UPI00344841A4
MPGPSTPVGPTASCHPDDYRSLMSAFPTGVSVVTSVGVDGLPRGLTCSALTSVTVAPPTLLVCLNDRSATLEALEISGRFAVNLLHHEAHRAARIFAGPAVDRFGLVPWDLSPHGGLPRLVEDAFAVAECRVTRTFRVSDHAVIVAEVTHAERQTAVPLLYGLRRFASWHDMPVAVPGDEPRSEGQS